MQDLVYIAIGSLTDTSWYTTQRMGTALAEHYRVLFVDLPATVGEVRRGRKTREMLCRPVIPRGDNLYWHCPPYWLPASSRALALRSVNQALARRSLRRAVRQLGLQRPIVWIDDVFRQDYLDVLDPSLVVYHCLHDFHQFAYLFNARYAGEAWSAKNAALDRALTARADLVLTPSAVRVERFRELNPNSRLFHMGVDVARHQQARENPTPLGDMDELLHPRIGFLGTVGRKKLDFELLLRTARARPQWQFVFVGRTFNVGMRNLAPPVHPQFHYLGEKPHELVPQYLARFDVALIPYFFELIPDLTLKFFEYMAAGVPLVVPELSQFREYGDLVYCYRDPETFITAIDAALHKDTDDQRRRRRALAAEHSFARQAERARAWIEQTRQEAS